MDFSEFRYVVAGAGLFGSVIAERIAGHMGRPVLVVDKRSYMGGNCFSTTDPGTGIHYHVHGTHIFHTSNKTVWEYINRFTEFNSYRHQVLTTHKGKVYQMPVNLETINSFYRLNLKPYEVDAFLQNEIAKEKITTPQNFEEKAISILGRPLYEAFIKGYTKKQWQKDPRELPQSILTRIPVRKNYNESYYFSRWQGVPSDGYTSIFEKMLRNPKIKLLLNTDFFEIRNQVNPDAIIIYSGSLDRYFDFKYGTLEYRTLRFEHETVPYCDFQGTSVMNFADENVPYTRIHEPRHLHPDRESVYPADKSLIIREYSLPDNGAMPYYPVNDDKNSKLAAQYREDASILKNVIIGGRMGDYCYYDMHETIEKALNVYDSIKKKCGNQTLWTDTN